MNTYNFCQPKPGYTDHTHQKSSLQVKLSSTVLKYHCWHQFLSSLFSSRYQFHKQVCQLQSLFLSSHSKITGHKFTKFQQRAHFCLTFINPT